MPNAQILNITQLVLTAHDAGGDVTALTQLHVLATNHVRQTLHLAS